MGAGWPPKDPARYAGRSSYPEGPWWGPLVPALVASVWWLIVARWLFLNADHLHASWNDMGCRSAAATWADAQAALALTGLLLSALAAGLFVRSHRPASRTVRVAAGTALLALLAWIVLVFGLDPREDLGAYAGCGQG